MTSAGGTTYFQCGGTVIHERYVLTAAHCVIETNSNKKTRPIAFVRVGEHEINKTKTYKDINIQKPVVHEKYDGYPTAVYDIALLRLAESINFTNNYYVSPICLPTTTDLRYYNLTNKNATVAGWGYVKEKIKKMSPILLKTVLDITDHLTCENMYRRQPINNVTNPAFDKVCAHTPQTGTCHGDSGGPLMIPAKYGKTMKYIQYGVVASTYGGCGENIELFTDVTQYMYWIVGNIAS